MILNRIIIFILLIQSILSAQLNQTYYKEQYRPQYHFSPEQNWMNDPNGLVYYNGKYHLFYQHYPEDIVWGPMHWGHSSSTNLLHWEHHPIALFPDSLGNIFSGSAVIDKNNSAGFGKNAMVAIFTYHNDSLWIKGFRNTESQGIAYSLDEGITWTKYENNPVLNNSGEQDFRDPKVFWNEDIKLWNMVLAVGDRIKIFSSPNLKMWKYESEFKPHDDIKDLGVWECPDLFKMSVNGYEKWVMIINHGDKTPNGGSGTRYFVGKFDGRQFLNEQKSIWLDWGTDYYAGVTFSNVPEEKKILISWMSNWQYAQTTPTTVWRSAMTLPRELKLKRTENSFYLVQEVIDEIKTISHSLIEYDSIKLPYEEEIDLSQTLIQFQNLNENLEIEFSNSLREKFIIELNDSSIITDRRISGKRNFNENFAGNVQIMPLSEEVYDFEIYLDRASAEILINDGKFSMTNIYFPNKKYDKIKITSDCNSKIEKLKVSRIERVWPKSIAK